MKALIQRVTYARVSIEGEIVGVINQGIVALIGVEKDDIKEKADKLLTKMLNYRVFSDEEGKMNLSLQDIKGGLLLVSQFTLVADTNKGLRPSFSSGASPEKGKQLYEYLVNRAKEHHPSVATGIFGAEMEIELLNHGPVTFLLTV